jgi:hypothetical protein
MSCLFWSLFTPLNRVSILPPPYPEHHIIEAPPIAVVLFHRRPTPIAPLHNDIHSDELADPLSLTKQLIVHVKIYFEIPQHHAELSTSIPMTQNPLALS